MAFDELHVAVFSSLALAQQGWEANDVPRTIAIDHVRASVASVPEPTTALLLACGLVGLGVRRRLH